MSESAPIPIEMWCVYDHPRDYPNSFVARLFVGEKATEQHIIAMDLETIRVFMANNGYSRIHRYPEDDPRIVEIWLV